MKNYMKYFLLMGLVSVASAAMAVEETIVTSEKQDPGAAYRLTSEEIMWINLNKSPLTVIGIYIGENNNEKLYEIFFTDVIGISAKCCIGSWGLENESWNGG